MMDVKNARNITLILFTCIYFYESYIRILLLLVNNIYLSYIYF